MAKNPSDTLVTIFGGSGFLGRHVVRALAKEGYRMRIAIRHPNLALFLRPMGHVGQIQFFKTNVLDDESVRAALAGAHVAINLVGVLTPSGRQNFNRLHIEAAARIATFAKAMGVDRFVHVSALGADLEAPARYFRSKAEGEKRVRAAFEEATIVRPALLFGPEDDFFNRFAALARMLPVLPLFGGGNTRFQPLFAGDAAAGIAAILRQPENKGAESAGRNYEFAGPEVVTFKEVMQAVLRETGRKCLLMPLPYGIGLLKGFFLGLLPKPPLTMDQVRMLKTDTVAHPNAHGLNDLGVSPLAAEAIVPSYLWRFRKRGQFEPATP